MDPITIRVEETRAETSVRRALRAHGDDAEIFYEFEGEALPPPADRADFAALGWVARAQMLGRDLHVDGPVSAALLERLESFQTSWDCIHPGRWQRIRVTAAEEVRGPGPGPAAANNSAIMAYSGGVDGAATLVRHLDRLAGRRTRDILGAVMIHGFDIALEKPEIFEQCRAMAADALSELGVPLTVARTNIRRHHPDYLFHWPALLASVLHQYRGAASYGLLGADQDHGAVYLEQGSNPLTNAFLDAHDFQMQFELWDLNRCARAALAARKPELSERLRVCFNIRPDGRFNCGKCEKCIRTRLNFAANGLPIPGTLPGPRVPTLRETFSRGPRTRLQVRFWEDIDATARANGVTDPWARWVRWVPLWAAVKYPFLETRRKLDFFFGFRKHQ